MFNDVDRLLGIFNYIIACDIFVWKLHDWLKMAFVLLEYVICMFQSPTHCYYPLEDITSEHKINKLIHQAHQQWLLSWSSGL